MLPPPDALEMNRGILRHKRSEFERREAASEVRRQQMDEERRVAEERKREEERLGEEERQRKYQLALEREEARKQVIDQGAGAAVVGGCVVCRLMGCFGMVC